MKMYRSLTELIGHTPLLALTGYCRENGLNGSVGGGFGLAAQQDEVLFGAGVSLPGIVDRDEGRGITFGAADVESGGIGRGVNR